jgi:hypothetical protein
MGAYAFGRSLLYMTGGWAAGDLKNHISNGVNSAVQIPERRRDRSRGTELPLG